ncbi:MAG: hypothetical protein ABJB66_13900 [Gemmatimonadaceae bacterium]
MKLKIGLGNRDSISDIEQQARALIDIAPDGPWGYAALGYAGMLAECEEASNEPAVLDPLSPQTWAIGLLVPWLLAAAPTVPYVVHSNALLKILRGDANGGMTVLGDMDLTNFDAHLTFHFAEIFAQAGNLDRGIDILALSVSKGFTPVEFIATHCTLIEPLRAHPRFAAIVQNAVTKLELVRRIAANASV